MKVGPPAVWKTRSTIIRVMSSPLLATAVPANGKYLAIEEAIRRSGIHEVFWSESVDESGGTPVMEVKMVEEPSPRSCSSDEEGSEEESTDECESKFILGQYVLANADDQGRKF